MGYYDYSPVIGILFFGRSLTVIIRGSTLGIEFQDANELVEVHVKPGMVGWDKPEPRVHRAINRGSEPYEEVVTFYKASSDVDPQSQIDI